MADTDFEFRVLPTGGLVLAGDVAAVDMCVADEVFSDGKLLPLRPSPVSRSASSSGSSSSGCVSRSHSSNSDAPPRRSLSSSVFYAHPSPSPQLRSSRPRRSTGSAPPWSFIRLGVVAAPDMYRPADAKTRGGRSEHATERKHGGVGLFGDGFGCKCSPDVVEHVALPVKKSSAANKRSRRSSRILEWLQELSIVIKDDK